MAESGIIENDDETKTWKMSNSIEFGRHTKRRKASLNGGKWNI
jgi:hypothetical protein